MIYYGHILENLNNEVKNMAKRKIDILYKSREIYEKEVRLNKANYLTSKSIIDIIFGIFTNHGK